MVDFEGELPVEGFDLLSFQDFGLYIIMELDLFLEKQIGLVNSTIINFTKNVFFQERKEQIQSKFVKSIM